MQLTHSPSPSPAPTTTPRTFPSTPPYTIYHAHYPLLSSIPTYPFFSTSPRCLPLSFPRLLALASNHRSTPNPFQPSPTLFLLPSILLSLPRSLSLPSNSTGLSILSGATFNPPPPLRRLFFSSLRRPIHRVSTCSTLSYRSPSEHTYPPP